MWTIIKFNKNKLEQLRNDFSKIIGKNFIIYTPKILIETYKKKKIIKKELNLLGDYLFCFHKDFKNNNTFQNLKFCRGLKYFLSGCVQSQQEIINFIQKCKNNENNSGYISGNFFQLALNKKYKFISGPLSQVMFEIVKLKNNKVEFFLGKAKVKTKQNIFLTSLV